MRTRRETTTITTTTHPSLSPQSNKARSRLFSSLRPHPHHPLLLPLQKHKSKSNSNSMPHRARRTRTTASLLLLQSHLTLYLPPALCLHPTTCKSFIRSSLLLRNPRFCLARDPLLSAEGNVTCTKRRQEAKCGKQNRSSQIELDHDADPLSFSLLSLAN